MRKLCVALGGMVLGGCFIVFDEMGGAVAVGVPTPAVAVAVPRTVAIVGAPGVYYCPGQPNVLFYGNRWWRHYGGTWQYATTYGSWLLAASVPPIFLRIPRTHRVYNRLVVRHPRYRKPGVVVKPFLRPGVVRPAPKVVKPLRPRVVAPAPRVVRPARPPTRVGKPPLARPGKPAKPAKPAKPGEKPEKDKKPKKRR